ncbi:MAG: response regulator [Schaedlerella sp.]|nr:response regulator [Schaedlerella sp.]
MKTILVDDMMLDMQLFEIKCKDLSDFEIIGKFTDPLEALSFAKNNDVEFALLDIDMPGMNGIELAHNLRQLRRDIIIVFVTAHPKFAVEALKMKADYMIFKPFNHEDISDVLERAKLLVRRQKKRFYFQTFGTFEMSVEGKLVKFKSAKSKELMALCVFREGYPISIHEMVDYLWEDESTLNYGAGYRRTIKELADTLKEYGADELLQRSRGSIQINIELADSDYIDFMNGDIDAICKFQGDFMQQYSWAETMVYRLLEKKELFLKNK